MGVGDPAVQNHGDDVFETSCLTLHVRKPTVLGPPGLKIRLPEAKAKVCSKSNALYCIVIGPPDLPGAHIPPSL
jgi:hypothetical protein